jgi:hypothetical protein
MVDRSLIVAKVDPLLAVCCKKLLVGGQNIRKKKCVCVLWTRGIALAGNAESFLQVVG